MTVVALKSKAETGSPKYRIRSGDVLVSDVILLEKSVETFLPISAPKPVNKPPSENPIVESADAPIYPIPAASAPTISFLTMFFFNNGDFIFPDTAGLPNVLD